MASRDDVPIRDQGNVHALSSERPFREFVRRPQGEACFDLRASCLIGHALLAAQVGGGRASYERILVMSDRKAPERIFENDCGEALGQRGCNGGYRSATRGVSKADQRSVGGDRGALEGLQDVADDDIAGVFAQQLRCPPGGSAVSAGVDSDDVPARFRPPFRTDVQCSADSPRPGIATIVPRAAPCD